MLVLCNFFKILMVSGKMIHRAFRTHTTLQTKPVREISNFHCLPKLYIGFNSTHHGPVCSFYDISSVERQKDVNAV